MNFLGFFSRKKGGWYRYIHFQISDKLEITGPFKTKEEAAALLCSNNMHFISWWVEHHKTPPIGAKKPFEMDEIEY